MMPTIQKKILDHALHSVVMSFLSFPPSTRYISLVVHYNMKGLGGAGRRSWSGVWSPQWPSSVALATPLVFELHVRTAVVEEHISCQHYRNPSNAPKAPFLHIDIVVVILVVASLKCSGNASVSSLAAPQLWHPWASSPSFGRTDTIIESGVSQSSHLFSLL